MTVVEQRAARRYVLGAHETRSVLGRREPAEVVVLLVGVLTGVAASLAGGGSAVGFLVLATTVSLAVAVVFLPVRGRTLYRWLPLDLRHVLSLLFGRQEYRSSAREAGVDVRTGVPVDVPAPAVVGRLLWLNSQSRYGDLAVVVQRDGALSACLEIEGPGVGLADSGEQEACGQRWGTLLRDLANADGLVRRVSLLERCLPTDAEAHQRYIERFGWVPAPPALADSYDELHRRVGSVSEQHRNFLVLRIPASRALQRAVRLCGGGDEGLAAVAAREADGIGVRLEEAGIRVVRALDEAATAALVSSCYAPWRSMDDTIGVTRRDAWPRRCMSSPQHLAAEGWVHSTAWIRSWPLVPVGVDFLAPLLVQTPGVVRTVAVTFELLPTDAAMQKVMSDLTADAAHASAAAKAGRTADPRDGRQLSQAEQRAQDVASGAAGVKVVGYVTVSAPDIEELDSARRQMRAAAARSWLTLEWCDQEHDAAFVNTLPLGRGLR